MIGSSVIPVYAVEISRRADSIVLKYAQIEDVEGLGGCVDLVGCRLLAMIIDAVLA